MPFPFHTRFHFHGIILPSLSTSLIPHVFVLVYTSPSVNSFLITVIHSVTSSLSSAARAHHALLICSFPPFLFSVAILNYTHVRLISQSVLSTLVPFFTLFTPQPCPCFVDLHKLDLVCLSETWIKPTTTSTEMINCTPPGYTFVSTPRNFTKSSSSTGGGTGFLIREPFTQLPLSVPTFSSFESSFLILKLPQSNLSVSVSIVLRHHPRTPSLPLFFSMNLVPSFLQRLQNFW